MRDVEDNKKVLKALKSLVSPNDPPEIDRATFHADLTIEYPLIEETEEEAKDWLTDSIEHDLDQIQIRVDDIERADSNPESDGDG